jgi:hypothetical protein
MGHEQKYRVWCQNREESEETPESSCNPVRSKFVHGVSRQTAWHIRTIQKAAGERSQLCFNGRQTELAPHLREIF